MKIQIALIMMCVLSAACMQEYPEKPDDGNGKACNLMAHQSTIEVQFSDSSLPAKLSANVNGMPVVNECTLGNENDSYLTIRNGNSVTILLRVGGNAALSEMFFNEDGTPKSNVRFQFELKGRDRCDETAGQIYMTTRTLDWQPMYSNNNKDCGPSGYSAKVSN